jgi:predicted metal-dependent peptidase
MYYDPEAIDRMSVDEVVGVVVHEIHHILRDHLARKPTGVDALTWNVAGDAEINDDLVGTGYQLPSGVILPSTLGKPDNLTAEEYLDAAQQMLDKLAKDAKPADCGSIAHGQPSPGELPPGDPRAPGVSAAEVEGVRRQTAKDILESSSGIGKVPAGLERWARGYLESRVDWRRELAFAIRASLTRAKGARDYTYARPYTRRGESAWILPSLYSPSPEIAVVVDTSGSIGDKTLAAAVAEVSGILRKVDAQLGVHLIACDAQAVYVGRVLDARAARAAKLPGGGGTDMGQGIALAETLHADVCVVLTDGLTPWPSAAPRCRTVVAILGGYRPGDLPHWARVIYVA